MSTMPDGIADTEQHVVIRFRYRPPVTPPTAPFLFRVTKRVTTAVARALQPTRGRLHGLVCPILLHGWVDMSGWAVLRLRRLQPCALCCCKCAGAGPLAESLDGNAMTVSMDAGTPGGSVLRMISSLSRDHTYWEVRAQDPRGHACRGGWLQHGTPVAAQAWRSCARAHSHHEGASCSCLA
jgi:hypothetical protein